MGRCVTGHSRSRVLVFFFLSFLTAEEFYLHIIPAYYRREFAHSVV